MKRFYLLTLAALSAALLPQSCGLIDVEEVNEIDTSATLGKGTEVTVVSEKKITLGDFLNFGSGSNGVIKVSAEGEYSIEYDLEPQSIGDGFSFDASKFALNVDNHFQKSMSLSKATIPAHTPIDYNPADRDAVELYIQNFASGVDIAFFESLLSQEYKFDFAIDFTIPGFPDLIKSFKKADLEGSFNFTLVPSGIPFNKFVFKKDTKIVFPEFLKFKSCSNPDFTLTGGNQLVANKDVDVPMGTGLAFSLELLSLDKGNGIATNGSLDLNGTVSVDGVISISPADFNGTTEQVDLSSYPILAGVLSGDGPHKITMVASETSLGTFDVTCNYAASNVALKNATIQLSKDAIPSFNGNYGFPIENLPAELSAQGNTIELSDVQVNLSVNSTLPFQFGLKADLDAVGNRTYHLGTNESPLLFAANAETKYVLGDFAKDETVNGVNYKKIEGLGQILNPIPSRIEVKNFDITFDENQWITAESGKNYGGTFTAGVKAPFAFSSNTTLSLGYEMSDLNVDLSVAGEYIKGDTRAVIKLQAINEIPFKFGLNIVAQDADKKPISGVKITPDVIEIPAGSIAQPATSPQEITITLPAGAKLIKGMSIEFSASVDSEHAGTPLNKNQSLTLKNVKLSLPDGVTMDLKDLGKK